MVRIIDDVTVRARGDEAIRHYSRSIDRVELDRIEVPRQEWQAALSIRSDGDVREAMEIAAGHAVS